MQIICPYCLIAQQFNKTDICSNCNKQLQKRYIQEVSKQPPICLGTFGLQNHGKTSYLASMTVSAESLHKILPGSFSLHLDDETRRRVSTWRKMANEAKTDMGKTQMETRPTPLITMIDKFPLQRPNVFVIYDLAGEVLDRVGSDPEYVRALQKVNTIWFVVSLHDLFEAGDSMGELFNIYQQAMERLNVSTKGKNILVVYTKADLLFKNQDETVLPEAVNRYLEHDQYSMIRYQSRDRLDPFDIDTYFHEMQEISHSLYEFTMDYVSGGGAFIGMAEAHGANVYFTACSAYGMEPEQNGSLGTQPHPMRVFDPLIWAVKLDASSNNEREAALILLPIDNNGNIIDQTLLTRFYDALLSRGYRVTTYYPGKIEPAFPVGVQPGNLQAGTHLPLVGPILDQLKPDTAVVLLAGNELPLDLDDFSTTKWSDALLVVAPRREKLRVWFRHQAQLSVDADVEGIIHTFTGNLASH